MERIKKFFHELDVLRAFGLIFISLVALMIGTVYRIFEGLGFVLGAIGETFTTNAPGRDLPQFGAAAIVFYLLMVVVTFMVIVWRRTRVNFAAKMTFILPMAGFVFAVFAVFVLARSDMVKAENFWFDTLSPLALFASFWALMLNFWRITKPEASPATTDTPPAPTA